VHYPLPIHLHQASRGYGYGPGSLPITERYAASTLSLPIYAEMTRAQLEYVVSAIYDFEAIYSDLRTEQQPVAV